MAKPEELPWQFHIQIENFERDIEPFLEKAQGALGMNLTEIFVSQQ